MNPGHLIWVIVEMMPLLSGHAADLIIALALIDFICQFTKTFAFSQLSLHQIRATNKRIEDKIN